jgi:general secretion pathway protein D
MLLSINLKRFTIAMDQYFIRLILIGSLIFPVNPLQAQEESPLGLDDRSLDFESAPPPPTYSSSSPGMNPDSSFNPNGQSPAQTPRRKSAGITVSSKKPSRVSKSGDKIENIDFQDAEIEDIVRTISQLTGKNFILDPRVKGKISIMAPSAVTVDEAYKAFLSALSINGFTVVPSGKFYKILPSRSAQRDSIDSDLNRAPPASDQMVTRIVKFKHLSANEVNRNLQGLVSKDGQLTPYEPSNSLIISDYGANMRRMLKILTELDRPGSEERLAVIPIRYAKAKDLAAMIEKVITKGQPASGSQAPPRFGGFPLQGFSGSGTTGGKTPELSLVTPDERTNSLVILGNQEGIDKVKTVVEELDFNLDPTDGGGVFVYRLRHSVAEQLAATLNGLAQRTTTSGYSGSSSGSSSAQSSTPTPGRAFSPTAGGVFGGDVRVTADKNTNSLIIVAGKQDYDVVRGLLAKLDIPRDQVFVEAIIMEINTEKVRDWKVAPYYLDPDTHGIGRAGFSAAGTLAGILNPAGDAGAVLSFGGGKNFSLQIGGQTVQVPSLLAFVSILQRNADANILSTPQILAMDNEEAKIEVGDQIPIGVETQTTSGGVITSSPKFDKATIKLVITPHISPETDSIRMKVDQSVRQASEATVRAAALRDITTIISDRSLNTNIVVENQDTVVLGGLIREEESKSETKVPLLGDLPVVGWLFKSSSVSRKKVNLLVFLTPKIIRSQQESRDLLGEKVDDRTDWMKRNLYSSDPFVDKIERIMREPPRIIRGDSSLSGATQKAPPAPDMKNQNQNPAAGSSPAAPAPSPTPSAGGASVAAPSPRPMTVLPAPVTAPSESSAPSAQAVSPQISTPILGVPQQERPPIMSDVPVIPAAQVPTPESGSSVGDEGEEGAPAGASSGATDIGDLPQAQESTPATPQSSPPPMHP